MGVKGLQSYVQNRLPLTDYIVELASLRAGTADAVVVDGMALIRKLYEQSRRLWKSSRPELRQLAVQHAALAPDQAQGSSGLCKLATTLSGLRPFHTGRSTG